MLFDTGQKYNKFISILIGVLFFIVVQIFTNPAPVFRFLVPVLSLIIVLVAFYNWYWLRRRDLFNFWVWLRPLLFYLSWFGLLALLTNGFWRTLFLFLSIMVIYLVQTNLGSSGEQLLLNEILITTFAFFLVSTGFSYYFINIPLVVFVVFISVGTLLIVRSYLEAIPGSSNSKWLTAISTTLFVAELFWLINFLPFHYTAAALLLFNCFYFFWSLLYYNSFNHLTWRKIQFHLLLLLIFATILLIVTPWKIIP